MGLRGRKHLSETRQALARAKGDRDGGLVFDSGNLTVGDCILLVLNLNATSLAYRPSCKYHREGSDSGH